MDDYEPQAANTGYKVITVFFLLSVSPIGFFFLWSPRLCWPVAVKILLTVLSLALILVSLLLIRAR